MKKTDTDEIWPQSEGGPKKPWNQREVSPHENRSKGPRMPTPNEVGDSPDPLKLAQKIDEHTLTNTYKHSRNKGKGFGGMNRLSP
ncbi:hypothetical protein Dform_00807 [Dehalogenimonas formicexedens]|uniref:Uncharacterized protein n=1 Tax=Dehalogenimonas formicexedens TaxID=1839801 RepID=A0A1P8F6V1_9CHLR|nr:hypothetical protein [Dehalogenimonas formicexedens]APV44155.1 hypothetical protein Dform_00807 [Dehalogenimonas formicexedens]